MLAKYIKTALVYSYWKVVQGLGHYYNGEGYATDYL